MPVLVSACLLGFPCRHDGADKRDARVLQRLQGEEIVPVCPEVAGGLPVPRAAAWLDGSRVIDASGGEVTAQFEAGALAAVAAARQHEATLAILKQNSPSCGTRMTGTSHGRAPGRGRAAQALAKAGLQLLAEDDP
ncbi:MAG TPA: DUF523 domain-containing protein [Myxococcales bacterium]|nr:DUF523 domain-containing protein [Myxococcales bacterium]